MVILLLQISDSLLVVVATTFRLPLELSKLSYTGLKFLADPCLANLRVKSMDEEISSDSSSSLFGCDDREESDFLDEEDLDE